MNMRSLRLRLFLAATVAVVLALATAGLLLVRLFEGHVTRHYDAECQSFLRQLASAVEFKPDGSVTLSRQLDDARFGEPLSGLYWQIEEDKTGRVLGSRSLWDAHIPLPKDFLPRGAVDSHVLPGPQGGLVRVQERMITFDLPQGSRDLRMAVAIDMNEIASARRDFAADLWPSLMGVGSLLLLATWIYIGVGLRPLDGIRRALNDVRAGTSRRLEGDFPSEVTPLVEEVNALLAAQEETLARARARATDLAHGLQTPLAVLQSDAERLRALGQTEIADEMAQLAGQMHQHVQRELARARTGGAAVHSTLLAPVLERLAASLRRTPSGEALDWHLEIPSSLRVAADPEDLTELFGSLLDNACKWARKEIRIIAAEDDVAQIEILDDGPGAPEAALTSLTARGVRLDQSMPGSGLGLAIARDIAMACGGDLQVSNRPGGGFAVKVTLPTHPKSVPHA
ncbi:MAG: HAMP domain-containing sensor histidine kinase [Alphaproteobacteria bacterium]